MSQSIKKIVVEHFLRSVRDQMSPANYVPYVSQNSIWNESGISYSIVAQYNICVLAAFLPKNLSRGRRKKGEKYSLKLTLSRRGFMRAEDTSFIFIKKGSKRFSQSTYYTVMKYFRQKMLMNRPLISSLNHFNPLQQ